ncbi:74_t:CDS:2 [Entrophospora sp. SA101]|nr:74_t:CDS:2 [Entrophospora sp. SA101]CAJ0912446.1 5642_t:CDS:2 [Entrophospora sp. SA101]CAJ0912462.1 5650_t:CDS:2 [Entrophospora sp. SA101]
MQRSRDEVMANIGDILEKEKNKFVLQREKGSSALRLSSYQKEIENQKKELDNDYKRIASLRDNIRSRRVALEDAKKRYQNENEYLEESYKILERDREALFETSTQLFARRRELISDLSNIYPLEHAPEISPFSYKIFGCDEEKIATALGFAAHFVQMLAYYLDTPLRFPITPMSSRSTILDPITVSLITSRQYPLYSKGVDRNGFEYAVYLLNKNIEQLMYSQELYYLMDLRHTLPNLTYLKLSLCSTSTSQISHLRKTIPHKCTINHPFNEINSSNSKNNNENNNRSSSKESLNNNNNISKAKMASHQKTNAEFRLGVT